MTQPTEEIPARAAEAPGSAEFRSRHALFYKLSAELTGFSEPELFATGLAMNYFEACVAKIGPEAFKALLAVAADFPRQNGSERIEAIQRRLYRTQSTRSATLRILLLWYTGTWFETLPYGGAPLSAQAYIEGLVWTAIAAHPMAAKPQGFGSWSLPAPNDPLNGVA